MRIEKWYLFNFIWKINVVIYVLIFEINVQIKTNLYKKANETFLQINLF